MVLAFRRSTFTYKPIEMEIEVFHGHFPLFAPNHDTGVLLKSEISVGPTPNDTGQLVISSLQYDNGQHKIEALLHVMNQSSLYYSFSPSLNDPILISQRPIN
jgi:hypothetical protein